MARKYACPFTGRHREPAPVVDVHPVRCRRGEFAPVERGEGPRDERPRVRVGGRFAGEVTGIELCEGGVDVVEVEHDDRRDPLGGVDLVEEERLGVKSSGPWSGPEKWARARARRSPRVAMTVNEMSVNPTSAIARDVFYRGISTVSDSGTHHATAIVAVTLVGHYLGHRVPVAGREVRQEALVCARCRVLQLRRWMGELFEPRERGVEVRLVEELAAVDQVAFDRQKVDLRHSASKPSCEVPSHDWVTTAPRSLSRCTAST